MNNPNYYRTLCIEERKAFQRDSSTVKSKDLSAVINYWGKLLNYPNEEDTLHFIKEKYNVNHQFLMQNFELEEHERFSHNNNWISHLHSTNDINIARNESHDYLKEFSSVPFFSFYELFVSKFVYENIIRSQATNELLSKNAIRDIIAYLINRLSQLSHKTLILEINSLRMENKLQGRNPEERYNHYCSLLYYFSDYMEGFINEYPVLIRLISETMTNFEHFFNEIMLHVETDKVVLENTLCNGNSIKQITSMKMGSGDVHNKGKTVVIMQFNNEHYVVYKPRSMKVDVQFQKLINWINEQNKSVSPLKEVKCINREEYGWMEFVPHIKCELGDDVRHFYYQLGRLLAILHVVNATDFHYENIIANGRHPVLIDLESLFHQTTEPDHALTDSPVVNKSLRIIRDSIISTGVLPNQIKMNPKTKKNFDISGISDTTNQDLPFQIDTLVGEKTDKIKMVKGDAKLIPGMNNPQSPEMNLGISTYSSEVCDGFSTLYKWLEHNKTELIKKIRTFADSNIRKILRNTIDYSKLLNLSYHPDFLRNQLDREILLNRIRRKVSDDQNAEEVAHHEIDDMLTGDIPYFVSSPNSLSIWTHNGIELKNFYYKTGLESSIEKIKNMDNDDCMIQTEMINSSLTAIDSKSNIEVIKGNQENNYNNLAETLGSSLLEKAIRAKNKDGKLEVCWTSMMLQDLEETNWSFSATGPGLYDGNTGISLFYAYLWKITQKDIYKDASLASIRPIITLIPDMLSLDNPNVGAFVGVGGIAYALHHLGVVFDDDSLIDICLDLVKELQPLISKDKTYDIVGGSAGLLIIIMNLYEAYKEEWLLDIAKEAAIHLQKNAHVESTGVSWVPVSGKPYIGFSHGNAGIVAALSEYVRHSNEPDIISLISKAYDYENSFYSEKVRNWYTTHLDDYPIAWCHGAPGILLSRCMSAVNGVNINVDSDIKNALTTTLKTGFGKTHTLCHGDLGIIDILMKVKELDSSLISNKKIDEHLKEVSQDIFESGVQIDIKSVGLLNGISSVGYGLLRAYHPSHVPSVLALDPPKHN